MNEGIIIRPPSEANSILLQVTRGCSHNKCTFCGVYKNIPFAIKKTEDIISDLKYASVNLKDRDKIFLCDGDALIIPQNELLTIFNSIKNNLPWVTRIGTYANAKCLARKTVQDLKELRRLGLRIIHLGLESGDDITLRRIDKWGGSEKIVAQCKKVQEADINLFITIMIGIAGTERSGIHAKRTGEILSIVNPNYVGALCFMPIENTPLNDEIRNGSFKIPVPEEQIKELRTIIYNTNMTHGYFYANHASNYLPLRIKFPHGKEDALALIDNALSGKIPFTPEWMRGL